MPDLRIATVIALLVAAGATYAQQPPAPVVQIDYVSETEIVPTVAVPGTIYSRNDVQVTAGVAGQLIMVAEPGTLVPAGAAVASIDKEPLLLQRAEQEVLLERAEINIRQLSSQLRRQQELQGSSLVSEFELEQTQANRDLAVADAKLIKVRLRQIDDQIRRADVRAPFTGVVTNRLHRAGEDVSRGEVLAAMTDIHNMEVRAFVPLKHLPRTVVGERIDVFATDTQFTGSIRSLVPTGDIRSQTFEARIDLPLEASGAWTVGQLVSVGIPIRTGAQTLAIPRDAMVLRQDGSYVFRINEENKAERIAVDIGDSAGDMIAVSGMLNAGDRVAVRGAENLREGAEVKILMSQSDAVQATAEEI
ncbi:MAG: efflux RND transporter periplasmic adaptor subunit [Woeseiaceae bacterium]|nr:efflux RND transporter periplasmic adaptor subunit [Woeseiaceae bacterium]NIP21556.1 efflux RND transporter periplasmic adaptor subunit [Woeseiaceae bacterium]NIS90544.1 efflux RND transporter periplasmic adaptor subunit [Woeseiaceae bacterium]